MAFGGEVNTPIVNVNTPQTIADDPRPRTGCRATSMRPSPRVSCTSSSPIPCARDWKPNSYARNRRPESCTRVRHSISCPGRSSRCRAGRRCRLRSACATTARTRASPAAPRETRRFSPGSLRLGTSWMRDNARSTTPDFRRLFRHLHLNGMAEIRGCAVVYKTEGRRGIRLKALAESAVHLNTPPPAFNWRRIPVAPGPGLGHFEPRRLSSVGRATAL